jgi:amino acid adenylation domain-containing protein
MSELSSPVANLPPEQEAIRAKCFHPTGTFVEFKEEEVEQSIPDRFEEMVRRHPSRLAVKTGGHAITYDGLNKAANRVARTIIHERGEHNEPIMFLLEHGVSAIISCLAILKAGKTFVAVDPSFPFKRIAYMLDDSQVGAILTDDKYLPLAEALVKTERRVINIDAIDNKVSNDNIGLHIPPDSRAHIRYTSGSTGQPKGIVRSHRRNLHSMMVTFNAGHICCHDRLLVLRHLSSAGAKECFMGLLGGAAVFPFDVKKNGLHKIGELMNEEKLTYYISTPSTFRYFINELSGNDRFPSVRVIQLGGEPLSRREVQSYKKHFPENCIILHQLSSNETGTVCQYFINQETEIRTPVAPVGYPVEGKEIFIVDESGKDVEIYQVGEIAVRSRYLSSGYWGNPALTDSKFLPASGRGPEQVCLTGDLGRMTPDGCLTYLGRKDHQVKVRGYRVAISEIELALLEHTQVKDAGVVAWEREGDEKYLAAYVVPRQEPVPTTDEMYDFLRKSLADYMMPSAFVFLESLPRTNGKLDRPALSPPDHKRPSLRYPYIPPRSEVEGKLTRIWGEVLKVSPIGIHDNFFDLGGHSLAATRVIAQVFEQFQMEVPLQSLFQSPTIAEMAAVITEHQAKKLGKGELDRILAELESLSDEEARRLLAEKAL